MVNVIMYNRECFFMNLKRILLIKLSFQQQRTNLTDSCDTPSIVDGFKSTPHRKHVTKTSFSSHCIYIIYHIQSTYFGLSTVPPDRKQTPFTRSPSLRLLNHQERNQGQINGYILRRKLFVNSLKCVCTDKCMLLNLMVYIKSQQDPNKIHHRCK